MKNMMFCRGGKDSKILQLATDPNYVGEDLVDDPNPTSEIKTKKNINLGGSNELIKEADGKRKLVECGAEFPMAKLASKYKPEKALVPHSKI